ncbi:hypothetical protein [Mycolicibacter heraklionensis]|nr:hypothetical protein [Mycolicibacter heraklionensis]
MSALADFWRATLVDLDRQHTRPLAPIREIDAYRREIKRALHQESR